jgi:hypothetical protein
MKITIQIGTVLSVNIHIPRNTPADIILIFTGGGTTGSVGSSSEFEESKIPMGLTPWENTFTYSQ